MKIIYLISIFLAFVLVSCTKSLALNGKVSIIASSTVIKVGEQATLTFDIPPIESAPGTNPVPGKCYGNLYLGNTGNRPFGDDPYLNNKKDFPVPSQLRVVTPVTGADNVPPLIPATKESNGHWTASFVIEGAQVGLAALGGDFVCIPDADPAYFGRYTGEPGKIFITVIAK